jgi:hypothetical protein
VSEFTPSGYLSIHRALVLSENPSGLDSRTGAKSSRHETRCLRYFMKPLPLEAHRVRQQKDHKSHLANFIERVAISEKYRIASPDANDMTGPFGLSYRQERLFGGNSHGAA